MNKKYNYKFSVIMSIYNVEEYLRESIESIINQTIGFEKNIQLILINDGSIDNSEEICLEFQKKYPNNIYYKYKKNGGVSSAKNTGLKEVKGEYVTFTDPDDILESNCLEEVYKFFNKNKLCVDLVTIPLVMFEAQEGLHGKYKYMSNKNRIINLIKEPYNFVLSSAATFYKYDVIKEMKFDENMMCGEDTKFNYELYKKNRSFGYVCENNVKYNYRKRLSETSAVDSLKNSKAGFLSIINFLELLNIKKLEKFEQELIIYEIRSRLKDINESFFDSKKEYNNLIEKYTKYLNAIPKDFILCESKWAESLALKLLILSFRDIKYSDLIKNQEINITQNITLKNYFIENNKFLVELCFNNYGFENLDVVAFDGNNKIYNAIISKDIDGPYNIKYGNFKIDDTHYRKFEFNLKENKIIKFIFINKENNSYIAINNMRIDELTKLALRDKILGLRYRNKIVTLHGRKFKISQNNKSSLKYNLETFINICKNYKYFPYERLFSRRKKQYILVNDRIDKAGDNGEAIFKYINKYRKDMAKKTYFVIDKNSLDYKRLKQIGKVVNVRSFKHKILFLNSKYIYSSHNHKLFYNAFEIPKLKYYSDLFNYTYVWLQHGIIKDDLSIPSNRLNTKNNYMVVSTNGERSEIIQEKYFFDDKTLILTGLARYDYLENKTNNIISICPTWRKELSGRINPDGSHSIKPGFENTSYYKNYKELLSNKKLLKLLEKNNFKLQFILHPGMNGYKSYFDDLSNDYVKIIKQEDVMYSKVFAETNLLITDFSSVFFDFAYLKKPEIFFQFDQDTFFENHYQKGYFEYERDAFGDVLLNVDDVIRKIEYYFNNEFKVEKKYLERIENTFKYTDKNNCKRIIDITYKK